LILLLAAAVLVIAGCKKKDTDPLPVPYTTFRLNGTAIKYVNWNYFGKDLCPYSTYCGGFYYYGNQSEIDRIDIGIPGDPIVGHVYHSGENRFKFFFFDNQGRCYTEAQANFSLTFSRWEGQGGWCNGTYSGWLKNRDNLSDSLYMDQGVFLSKIWTFFSAN
jgi:hypothetical protein